MGKNKVVTLGKTKWVLVLGKTEKHLKKKALSVFLKVLYE